MSEQAPATPAAAPAVVVDEAALGASY